MGPSTGQKGGDGVEKGRGDLLGTNHDPQGPKGMGSQTTAPLREHPGNSDWGWLLQTCPRLPPHNQPLPCNLQDKWKLFSPHLPGTPNKSSEF